MDLRKTLTSASAALSGEGIQHALIGGFSLAVYGVHRTTQDIDFLANGSRRDDVIQALIAAGFDLKIQTYCNEESRRLQDQADIQNLIRKSPAIDWERVRTYADLFDEWATIESLRKPT